MTEKIRLISANALTSAISAEQTALVSDDDKEWKINKPYFKGLATAQMLVRKSPTIAELSTSEIAGLRGLLYRGQFPDHDVVSDLLARAEAAEAKLARYTVTGLEPCDYTAVAYAMQSEMKARQSLDEAINRLAEVEVKMKAMERRYIGSDLTRADMIRRMGDKEMVDEIKHLVFELYDDGVPSDEEILNYLQQKAE